MADAALLCGVCTRPFQEMSRIVVAAAAIAMMITTTVAWSNFMVVKPEAAAAATTAPVAEGRPIISPFDIMIRLGKNLPLEDWRPAH